MMEGPRTVLRRTPLLPQSLKSAAEWGDTGGSMIVERTAAQRGAIATVGIADLSPLPRVGFKGRGTVDAMKRRGLSLEAIPNRVFMQADGTLCLVLGSSEVLLLSDWSGQGSGSSFFEGELEFDAAERTYPLLRRDSHAWFAVSGKDAAHLFAKVCAVDLRPTKFPDLSIAQTVVANVSAIVARADAGGKVLYHLLSDSTAAIYLCEALLDAGAEFGGALVGRGELLDIPEP